MVLRLTSRSPRRSGLFVTVVCASSRRLDAGVEASGPHDFAVRSNIIRPRATCAPDAAASTASRPNVRDDGQRPSSGRNGAGSKSDLGLRRSGIFLQRGLDTQFTDLPVEAG